jgi:hypothetical protein
VNGDRTDQTFEYLNEEYRAWYVGYEAENGHPPSNQEAMDRWEYFLNPNGGYADYAHGTESGLPFGVVRPGRRAGQAGGGGPDLRPPVGALGARRWTRPTTWR